MGVINYAVPMAEVDGVLDEIVCKLLMRPPIALGRTKKILNKRLIDQWNLTQDLAAAYQKLDFWEHAAAGHLE